MAQDDKPDSENSSNSSLNKTDLIKGRIEDMFVVHKRGDRDISAKSERGSSGIKVRQADLEYATVVLLVDIAMSDQNFSPVEVQVISEGMIRLFGSTKAKVQGFIHQARNELGNLRGANRQAEILKKELEPAKRSILLEIIDELVAADASEGGFEIYLREKYRAMLEG